MVDTASANTSATGALLAVLLALALSACGGSSGRDVLRDASENLGTIRSGVIHARFFVQPRGAAPNKPFGFTVDGPFRFGEQESAKVTYVQIANGRRATTKLVVSPSGGYIVADGQRRTLDGSQLDGARRTLRAVRAGGSIVDVSSWVKSSKSTDCPAADAAVRCVRGDLDPVEAVNGLLALEQATARCCAGLGSGNADQLSKAVRKATFFVMAGKEDKLLRDLRIDLEMAVEVPESLRGFLGRLIGADVRFELRLDRPNAQS
jgi:hypothetical protein